MHTSKHRSNQTHLSVSITCYFLQSSANKYKQNYIHIHTEHKETSPNDDTCCETQHKLSINIIKFVYSHRSNERENRKQIHKLYTSLLSCYLPFSSLRAVDTEEYTLATISNRSMHDFIDIRTLCCHVRTDVRAINSVERRQRQMCQL